jgi:signal transduction histidine kinase
LFSGQSAATIHFAAFYHLEELIYGITSVLNNLYLGAAVILILVNYFQTKRLHYFRAYSLFIATGFTSIVLLFYTLFWWAPKRLISVTTMTDMVHILPVSLFLEGRMLTLFPYFASASFVCLVYAMYRYNNDYLNYKSIGRSIEKTIDLTGLGISFFSHMVKNYAIATVVDAERLQRKIAEGEDGARYLERIIASNNELLQRLADVKAKLSVDSLELAQTHIFQPLQEALDKICQDGIQIIYRYNPHTPPVLMDRTHVSEVFYNILQNAVTAMDKEPRILKIEVEQEKTWVVATISDTGKGIPKEHLDTIFVPFYTTDNSRDSWGLGLSYCYRIMLAHKGKIFVESELGKGTTFKVLFPITEK